MAQDSLGGDLRIGHAERDAAVTVLQDAAADGRLSMAELEERVEAALSAKTYTDLDALVADLSVELPWRRNRGLIQRTSPTSVGYSREDPLRLDGGMSSEKRTGPWTVPPFMVINQGLGSVRLNCLEATPAAELIDIVVIGGAGSVLLVLPTGWAVDADRLSKAWGTKRVRAPHEPAAGRPLLLISGSLGLGTFRVRPPYRFEQRRLDRRLRRPELSR